MTVTFLPQCFIALAMIGIGDIGGLVDFFSFTAWLFYGTAAASLLVMRYTKRDIKRIIKVDIQINLFMHSGMFYSYQLDEFIYQ